MKNVLHTEMSLEDYDTINEMDILWMLKEINMQWNLTDVGITDVHNVTAMIENHYRLWE